MKFIRLSSPQYWNLALLLPIFPADLLREDLERVQSLVFPAYINKKNCSTFNSQGREWVARHRQGKQSRVSMGQALEIHHAEIMDTWWNGLDFLVYFLKLMDPVSRNNSEVTVGKYSPGQDLVFDLNYGTVQAGFREHGLTFHQWFFKTCSDLCEDWFLLNKKNTLISLSLKHLKPIRCECFTLN